MRQFDGPKKKKNSSGFDALNALAEELESGQEDTDHDEGDFGDAGDEEIEEGAFDERDGMTADEIRELERSVQPVQRVLVKVRLGT
jgi:TATA-binding protein-associated factor Taf7